MKSEYWHGVDAALKGMVFDFKEPIKGHPAGYTHFPKEFIKGYMSVLRGEHFGFGIKSHLFDKKDF